MLRTTAAPFFPGQERSVGPLRDDWTRVSPPDAVRIGNGPPSGTYPWQPSRSWDLPHTDGGGTFYAALPRASSPRPPWGNGGWHLDLSDPSCSWLGPQHQSTSRVENGGHNGLDGQLCCRLPQPGTATCPTRWKRHDLWHLLQPVHTGSRLTGLCLPYTAPTTTGVYGSGSLESLSFQTTHHGNCRGKVETLEARPPQGGVGNNPEEVGAASPGPVGRPDHRTPPSFCQGHPIPSCGEWRKCPPGVPGSTWGHPIQNPAHTLPMLWEHPEAGLQHDSLEGEWHPFLLNTLRDQEITPHKLQGIWNTLRWFSARFGLLDPDSLERLKAKRKTIQEGLVETNIKPQRKAQLPSKEVIMLLEKVASGAGLTGPLTAKNTLDRYICAIARFQVACSARFNDLQHTSPGGYKLTESTLELQAWQTKTVSAFRIKKNPVPLIAPLYTFTGMDWWSILPQAWDRLVAQEKFKDMDYLIPTVSSDFTGLIPRPGQADRTLRWLKDALHRQGALDTSTFKHLSWHSFRVFIPDCAYQLGMPRDQRQYLGNWTTESTADIYTREKRKVVQRAWTAVADKLGKLDLSGSKSVPIDLDHKDWDTEILELDPSPPKDSPDKLGSPPFKSRKQALAEKQAASPVSSTGSWQKISGSPGLPEITQQGAPLRVVSASKVNRSTGLMNIHLLNHDGKAVGCGWQPSASKALDLNPEDYRQEPHRYAKCTRCFKSHDFPQDWGTYNQVELAGTSDSDSDALSSDLFSDDANDTASDDEKLPAGTLVKWSDRAAPPLPRLASCTEGGGGNLRSGSILRCGVVVSPDLRFGWILTCDTTTAFQNFCEVVEIDAIGIRQKHSRKANCIAKGPGLLMQLLEFPFLSFSILFGNTCFFAWNLWRASNVLSI